MKRRSFGLLASTSMLALMGARQRAFAQAADFATLSTTTLTPLGSERAGNATGTIPAWTGGYTTIPAGWMPDQEMPDFFADDQPVVVINSSNMEQYKDRLSDGVMAMMTKYGYSIKVYPTHRTASATQWVYDNIALNATRATLDPGGPELGFSNAYGGVPFPIPDASDPLKAGAQIMWNHNASWKGYQQTVLNVNYIIENGGSPVLSAADPISYRYDYYNPNGTIDNFTGDQYEAYYEDIAPATAIGSAVIVKSTTNPYVNPVEAWEVLAGQGRVRKSPEVQYDTPFGNLNGVVGYDEVYGFNGALNEYDWRLIGKQEMYIPYNNNKLRHVTSADLLGPNFLNPELVRWELHRVWVVDATLRPGERNVLPHRRYYVDEDTWTVYLGTVWDAQGNLWKSAINCNVVRPDVPGTIRLYSFTFNLLSNSYVMCDGGFKDPPPLYMPMNFHSPIPDSVLNPSHLAAETAY